MFLASLIMYFFLINPAVAGYAIDAKLKWEVSGQSIEGHIKTGEKLSFGDYLLIVSLVILILAVAYFIFKKGKSLYPRR